MTDNTSRIRGTISRLTLRETSKVVGTSRVSHRQNCQKLSSETCQMPPSTAVPHYPFQELEMVFKAQVILQIRAVGT